MPHRWVDSRKSIRVERVFLCRPFLCDCPVPLQKYLQSWKMHILRTYTDLRDKRTHTHECTHTDTHTHVQLLILIIFVGLDNTSYVVGQLSTIPARLKIYSGCILRTSHITCRSHKWLDCALTMPLTAHFRAITPDILLCTILFPPLMRVLWSSLSTSTPFPLSELINRRSVSVEWFFPRLTEDTNFWKQKW